MSPGLYLHLALPRRKPGGTQPKSGDIPGMQPFQFDLHQADKALAGSSTKKGAEVVSDERECLPQYALTLVV
jgi:hypothetical protein